MRYFRCEGGDEVYEAIRLTLDAAWSHPNPATKTTTCFEPAATGIRDESGRLVLAVHDEFVEMQPAASMLPDLLSHGDISEITAGQYQQVIQRLTP